MLWTHKARSHDSTYTRERFSEEVNLEEREKFVRRNYMGFRLEPLARKAARLQSSKCFIVF